MIRKLLVWSVLSSALIFAPSSFAVSFDCSRFTTGVYKMICDSPELSRLDDQLYNHYLIVRDITHNDDVFKDFVRAALRQRDACADAACLRNWYQVTIRIYEHIENDAVRQDVRRNDTNTSTQPTVPAAVTGITRSNAGASTNGVNRTNRDARAVSTNAANAPRRQNTATPTRRIALSTDEMTRYCQETGIVMYALYERAAFLEISRRDANFLLSQSRLSSSLRALFISENEFQQEVQRTLTLRQGELGTYRDYLNNTTSSREREAYLQDVVKDYTSECLQFPEALIYNYDRLVAR